MFELIISDNLYTHEPSKLTNNKKGNSELTVGDSHNGFFKYKRAILT